MEEAKKNLPQIPAQVAQAALRNSFGNLRVGDPSAPFE
jgi:hypothetical protein